MPVIGPQGERIGHRTQAVREATRSRCVIRQ
jgi:hypothetical protein